MNMCQAITNAIDVQMMRDESTIVFGEDVKFGGVFRCTVSPYSVLSIRSLQCNDPTLKHKLCCIIPISRMVLWKNMVKTAYSIPHFVNRLDLVGM